MIEELYAMPFFLRRHREGLFGPHVNDFTDSLVARGYTAHTIRGVLRAMRAFGEWLAARSHAVHDVDDRLVARFASKVRCSRWTRRSYRACARHVLEFLRSKGVIAPAAPSPPDHQIVIEFSAWMAEHRGVRPSTIDGYLLLVRELLHALRDDVRLLTARRVRAFVLRCRFAASWGHFRGSFAG
jgi:hypothetical protein